MAQILEYSIPRRRRWPARLLFGVVTTLLVAFAILVLPSFGFTDNTTSFDNISGTMRVQTHWPIGITTERVRISPLEERLKKMSYQWTPNWMVSNSGTKNCFGQRLVCGVAGTLPPIMRLSRANDFMAIDFTDDEVLAFVKVMETGTETEQKAAVDGAIDCVLERMDQVQSRTDSDNSRRVSN